MIQKNPKQNATAKKKIKNKWDFVKRISNLLSSKKSDFSFFMCQALQR